MATATTTTATRGSRIAAFRRFTYGDVLEEPRFMLAELRGLLGA